MLQGSFRFDELLEAADEALCALDFGVWLILDRLDVAFVTQETLEQSALRALFRVYLDFQALNKIAIKIFLRTDIWRSITGGGGFREASHITRSLTISWERQSLLNVVMRRTLRNRQICELYGVDPLQVLASVPEQEALLKRMFPQQVDLGRNPATFDWMLSRTQDGSNETAPRELIHLVSSLRESQLKRYEVGHDSPPGEQFVDRAAFKDALRAVSDTRLNSVLYAEYPGLKPNVERLEGEKTQQTPDTLAVIWGINPDGARQIADQLTDIGFFERRGEKQAPVYWVPFLYRDSLRMVQGEAR